MYTQCSRCSTLFRVSVRHLREAQGQVRCCLCHQVFDALPTLTDRLPPDLPAEDGQGGWRPPRRPQPQPQSKPAPDMADGGAAAVVDDDLYMSSVRDEEQPDLFVGLDLSDEFEAEPVRVSPRGKSHWRTGLIWGGGTLLLILLLVVQYAYIMRDDLSQDARLRPWLETMCAVAGCELPLLRDLESLHILQRRVMGHPEREDALMVRATLVNDAAFPQPYPEVRLRFLNAAGQVTAERWFKPQEYLEEQPLRSQTEEGMPPMQPIAVRLDLVDPGEGAAENFDIEFR